MIIDVIFVINNHYDGNDNDIGNDANHDDHDYNINDDNSSGSDGKGYNDIYENGNGDDMDDDE